MTKAVIILAGIILYMVIVWKVARFVGAFCSLNDKEVDRNDHA